MKKTMAYASVAILLGFAVMMLPLALETGPPTFQPELRPQFMNVPSEGGEDSSLSRAYGLAAQPSNLLPSSLVLFTGLIVALGVYAILKRRMI